MMIHKIIPYLDYNQWLKRLETQLNEPTNQNSFKVPKVVKYLNKKTILKDFGDQYNKQSLPALNFFFFNYSAFLHTLSHTHTHKQTKIVISQFANIS